MKEDLRNTKEKGHKVEEQSLRFFLDKLEDNEHLLFNIQREDYLLSAIVYELESKGKFPIVEFRHPSTGERTIANVFANRDTIKKCIFNIVDTEEKIEEFNQLDVEDDGPVQELIFKGEDLNILDLPIYKHFPGDAGRYITSGIVIAKDPDTGRHNFSFHRMQLKDRNKMGISLHSRGDLWRYYNRSKELNKNLEIAVVIGTHPAYYITGATKIPQNYDDYSWASTYMNQNAKVVKGKTVDIYVPAQAEYVIEGYISVDELEDEGPFAEYTGYGTDHSTRNVFYVTCITKREDAIYQDLVPGFAWEHLLLSQFTKEIILLDKLKKEIPEVMGLSMPKNGCHFHAYMAIDPKAEGQVKQAMMLLFGLDPYLKLIIAVNSDIDIYDEEEVIWSMATRMQADRDVFIVPKVICNSLDPSSINGMSAKMGIDATKALDWKATKIRLPEDLLEEARKMLDGEKNFGIH
ncbi:MAG: UbiD family decarboxylase [Tissierellaceae bacterium]|nr:UbiD family decarboxylase [Tissierellaceae bacterium]